MNFLRESLLGFLAILISVVFNYASADTLIIEPDMGRQPLLNLLSEAHTNIDIVMYGFTDQTFVNALVLAKKSGEQVRVLIEPHPYRSAGENLRVIKKLRQ